MPWSIDRSTVLFCRAHTTSAPPTCDAIVSELVPFHRTTLGCTRSEYCDGVDGQEAGFQHFFSQNASTDSDEIADGGCQFTGLPDTVTALTGAKGPRLTPGRAACARVVFASEMEFKGRVLILPSVST